MHPSATHRWRQCLPHLERALPRHAFLTWIQPAEPVALAEQEDEARLTLALPSRFHLNWMRDHYAGPLREAVVHALGPRGRIDFVVREPREQAPRPPQRRAHTPAANRPPRRALSDTSPLTAAHAAGALNASYTFEEFVEGDCNKLACSAAGAVAEKPGGTSFNPLVIYGAAGLGKTHLAQAIGHGVRARAAHAQVCYLTSEHFTSAFVAAVKQQALAHFTAAFSTLDVLIVDDVQFFGGKEKTQETFFHIFNRLHHAGKQLVLCTDRPPARVPGIEERLLSRVRWGLTTDVQPPDLDTRVAILQRKAATRDLDLPSEVVAFVAEHVCGNIRSLEGALNRLHAYARLHRSPLTLETARGLFRDLAPAEIRPVSIADVQQYVARHRRLDAALLTGRSRKRDAVDARQLAMYLCRTCTRHSLAEIGARFDGRDHSTVLHACRKISDRMDVDPAFRQEVACLERRVAAPG